ncbi:MAG: branched-chain amino acid ABC transporter permease [Proteobacteria bacterium]|nr:branched-chain amino acid ABC transporter permease [Pseudomonadota bacterium]
MPTRISQVLASPAFCEGARDMRAVGLGVSAWGLVTGVAMVKSGLSVGLALIISLTVFAGSAQLAALPLIAAGAPLLLVLGAAFCVNLRFVVFSAQMRPYLERLSLRRRLVYGYLIGDVNLVMMLRRHPIADGSATQTQYFLGGGLTNWVFWQVPSIAGILLADLFPDSWGVGFAGTLALLAIVLGLMANRAVAGIIIMASALSTALFWLPLKLNLVLAILLALMVGMSWDAWAQRRTGLAI